MEERIPVGISACLLGQEVRYDGGHKRDPWLMSSLGPFVNWVPVCPEVELGMGTPREPVNLVQKGERTHMVGAKSGEDWTDRMEAFARRRIARLPPLSGYVFKSKSPSCGPFRVKLYSERGGPPSQRGTGLFAAALRASQPLLPIEDEGRLHDPVLRENFVERVFAFHRLQELLSGRFSARRLVEFHTAHKYQVLSHDPAAYEQLGRVVATLRGRDSVAVKREYAELFMRALEKEATPRKHANVLQHMLGFFKQQLTRDEKQEVLELITDFRKGRVPLVAPVTLIKHFVRRYGQPWLAQQTYLLRKHV